MGSRRRVRGRVHAVDHPVLGLLVLVDREQRVAPLHALAVQERPRSCAAPTCAPRTCRGPRRSSCPAPYWPLGISPWNSRYSSGWSSVCTARRLSLGASGMPLGIAHEASTPSCSSRRSQCRRVAWCSWTTKRRPSALAASSPIGSGVFCAERLDRYVSSLPLTRDPEHTVHPCSLRSRRARARRRPAGLPRPVVGHAQQPRLRGQRRPPARPLARARRDGRLRAPRLDARLAGACTRPSRATPSRR